MAKPTSDSTSTSDPIERSEGSGLETSLGDRERRGASPEDGDHLSGGHSPGIPGEGRRELTPDVALLESFKTGNPELVYGAATALVEAFRQTKREVAKERFRANFGTRVCDNCEGLKAGPGVLATCFQVRLCNYSNIKESDQNPKQLRVLSHLTEQK